MGGRWVPNWGCKGAGLAPGYSCSNAEMLWSGKVLQQCNENALLWNQCQSPLSQHLPATPPGLT